MNEETKPGLSAEEMSKILYPYPDLSVFNNEFDKENIMYRENRCRQAFILGHKKASEQTTALQQENQRLREANEWVSVEDRLPENEERILCWVKETYNLPGQPLIGFKKPDGFEILFRDSANYSKFVTHWKPLPTKPTTKNK